MKKKKVDAPVINTAITCSKVSDLLLSRIVLVLLPLSLITTIQTWETLETGNGQKKELTNDALWE